ncbi:MAG: hypothetical protein GY832_30885 [Chloroflexi bacterium]|nr:hypothetical protein [Chloroflexota bacterium]
MTGTCWQAIAEVLFVIFLVVVFGGVAIAGMRDRKNRAEIAAHYSPEEQHRLGYNTQPDGTVKTNNPVAGEPEEWR